MIPTWIYFKVIRFSSFIDLLKISKPKVCEALCDLYKMQKPSGKPNIKLLISSLSALRKIRNSCAHNERVYDFKRDNGRIFEPVIQSLRHTYCLTRDQKIIDALIYLKYYLDSYDYERLILGFKELLVNLQASISVQAFDKVRAATGVKQIADLDDLLKNKIIKNYNKF